MYLLVVPQSVQKQLAKALQSDKARIESALREIEADPFQGKKLAGELKGIYSVRVTSFRILYEIRKQQLIVLVIRIGNRKDVYR